MTESELAALYGRFHDAHTRAYGFALHGSPLEIVNLRTTAIVTLPQPTLERVDLAGETNPARALRESRDVVFQNIHHSTSVYDRALLLAGDSIEGPAIIEQFDSTTAVWPRQSANVDQYGNLFLGPIAQ